MRQLLKALAEALAALKGALKGRFAPLDVVRLSLSSGSRCRGRRDAAAFRRNSG